MIDFDITDLLLGVVSVLLTYSTIMSNRRKDSKNAGAQEATLHSDIKYIKELLQDVRSEMKELTKITDRHAERITKCETRLDEAFNSIARLEQKMNVQREE